MVSAPHGPFARAAITPDGEVGACDDSRRGVVRFELAGRTFWFTPEHRFLRDSTFETVIHFFGFTQRSAAGTKTGEGRATFSLEEAASVKDRLTRYYTGPEDKRVFPFSYPGTTLCDVVFEDGWIRIKS